MRIAARRVIPLVAPLRVITANIVSSIPTELLPIIAMTLVVDCRASVVAGMEAQ